MLFDVRQQPRIDNARPIAGGITAAREVEGGATEIETDLLGPLVQRFQALREQDHVGFIDRRPGDRGSDVALMGEAGEAWLPLLRVGARVANPIAPFLATGVVPSPWSTRVSRCVSAARGRTRARNAGQSAPASAHVAKTL
jgi:hypothetical protein